jgi:replicative DNA helicase
MDRQLPHNLDSEKIVIGSILSDVNAFSEVSPVLQAEMFYNPFHKELYEEIERQAKKGKIPDLVLLCDKYSGNTTAISNIEGVYGR